MLNDESDRHVLAAAVRARATVIVTNNPRDFSARSREPYGIDVLTADDFLCSLWEQDSGAMTQALQEQAGALINPPQTVHDVLTTLERSVPAFVALVREWLDPNGTGGE